MKVYFKAGRIIFLLLSIFAFTLNFWDSKQKKNAPDLQIYPLIQRSANIIISVNWTGSITEIGNRNDSRTYYLYQLRNDIKEQIKKMVQNFQNHHEINISYCFFGLVQPEDSREPNPDFRTNYIKIFKTNCKGFNDDEWNEFISELRKERKGLHTALTVAKQFSASIVSPFIQQQYDDNYLILVSDRFFNVSSEEEISEELKGIQNWSEDKPAYKKISNIDYASEQTKEFSKLYRFANIDEIPILPNGITINDEYFRVRLDKIVPPVRQEPENLFSFPEKIKYEFISSNSIRMPLDFSWKMENVEQLGYTPTRLVLSVIDSKDGSVSGCFYQKNFSIESLPDELKVKVPPKSSFKILGNVYYDYRGSNIFPSYQENHGFEILCERINGGKLAFLFPVKGKLLDLHDTLGILEGQKSVSTLWNSIIFFMLLSWSGKILRPYYTPPPPKVIFTLKKGDKIS